MNTLLQNPRLGEQSVAGGGAELASGPVVGVYSRISSWASQCRSGEDGQKNHKAGVETHGVIAAIKWVGADASRE